MEREMNDSEFHTWVKPDFPPWSVKTLVLWMVGFLIFSVVAGGIFGTVFGFIIFWFKLGMNFGEQVLIVRLIGQAIVSGIMFIFIISRLRNAFFTLKDTWLSNEISPVYISTTFILGVLVMSLSALFVKAINGEVAPPPMHLIRFNIGLVILIEILVYAFIVGLVEEVFFRGLIYQALRRKYSVIKTILLSTIIFGLYHVELILFPLNIFSVTVFGVLAGAIYQNRITVHSFT